ncbi:phosphohydrolase, partial [Lampropedia puyangensis]
MKSIAAKLLAVLPWNKRASLPAPAAAIQQSKPEETAGTESAPAVAIAGSRNGWLRVLTAHELLQVVHGQRVIDKIYTQSRLSETVFARDFVPAIHAYCEFVQLAPASEAHHHAHVGGLLSHTLEMVLAAMTWRNGHLLPEGEVIEVIDAQRDHWTYVVFFAALLHDVAKPMTDLRISWRSKNMDAPLRWAPVAGSLTQVTQGRPESHRYPWRLNL